MSNNNCGKNTPKREDVMGNLRLDFSYYSDFIQSWDSLSKY